MGHAPGMGDTQSFKKRLCYGNYGSERSTNLHSLLFCSAPPLWDPDCPGAPPFLQSQPCSLVSTSVQATPEVSEACTTKQESSCGTLNLGAADMVSFLAGQKTLDLLVPFPLACDSFV